MAIQFWNINSCNYFRLIRIFRRVFVPVGGWMDGGYVRGRRRTWARNEMLLIANEHRELQMVIVVDWLAVTLKHPEVSDKDEVGRVVACAGWDYWTSDPIREKSKVYSSGGSIHRVWGWLAWERIQSDLFGIQLELNKVWELWCELLFSGFRF